MANVTKDTFDVLNTMLIMRSMNLSREGAYITITIVLLAYIFSVVCNLLIILTIAFNRSLHEPMYILLCNLSFNDIIGITALLPRTVYDIMFEYSLITLPACLIQAWCLHTYGGITVLTLSVMAFDRYVAICHPLRYHTIMSKITLIRLVVFILIFHFIIVGIVFGLTLQYPFCRNELPSYFCDNMSILKLTCAKDTTVNNIYGLFITAMIHAFGLSSIVFSYTWILIICCRNNDSESKSKAWHTCGTHLTVFVIYEISNSAVVLVHRFPNSPETLKNVLALTGVIIPSCFNPVIYGLQTKQVKSKVNHLKNRIFGLNTIKPSKTGHVTTISPG